MDGVSKELYGLIYALLPGFLAAWIFYGLTAHPKKIQFERIVEALIFTAIIELLLPIAKMVWWRYHHAEVHWEDRVRYASLILAVIVGVVFALIANWNLLHLALSKIRVTTRTSFPSEWYSAFRRGDRWVVLHLKGSLRLKGWAEEWPDQSDKGHFLIRKPVWLVFKDGVTTEVPIYQTHRMIINSTEVEMVEQVYDRTEVRKSDKEIASSQKPLLDLHQPEIANEREVTGITGEQGGRTVSQWATPGAAGNVTGSANGGGRVDERPAERDVRCDTGSRLRGDSAEGGGLSTDDAPPAPAQKQIKKRPRGKHH